jgi:hypothetical protein
LLDPHVHVVANEMDADIRAAQRDFAGNGLGAGGLGAHALGVTR